MGKKAKEHRKRVAKRNQRIADEKKRMEKATMEFLRKLIDRENAEGKFNSPIQPFPNFEGFNSNIFPMSGPSLGLNLPNDPSISFVDSNENINSTEAETKTEEAINEEIQSMDNQTINQ